MSKHGCPCKSVVWDTQWSRLAQTHAKNSAGVGVISIGNGSKNSLDNKALALPNVNNLRRLLLCLTIELLPAILTVMQHS